MTSREELIERQRALEQVYDEVKAELMKIPGVVGVGIGIKETGNELTDDIAFRVYVAQKKEVSELPPDQLIPKEIRGFKTDVIRVYKPKLRAFVERRDSNKYRPIKGGITIRPENDGSGGGTLGWFATLDSDSSTVLLSNKHVVYDDTDGVVTDAKKVGQPFYKKSCCCECDYIADGVIGIINDKVDCAIAKIRSDITVSLFISNDSSDNELLVSGSAAAVVGETVRKIGKRSGFTTGVVIDVGAVTATPPTDPDGNPVTIIPDQVLVRPSDAETYELSNGKKAFSNFGDSGSVIINEDDEIIALLYSGDDESYSVDITFANNISNVLSAFSDNGKAITLKTSPEGGGRRDVAAARAKRQPVYADARFADENMRSLFERVLEREDADRLLADIFRRNSQEVIDLVNYRRPVAVTWQRKHGPAYLAAIARSARESAYRIPEEIHGVRKESALMSLLVVLEEHGSSQLKSDINQYSPLLLSVFAQYDTVEEIIEAWKKEVSPSVVEELVCI